MTPNFDSAAYLKRLGFHRHDGPTLESLAALQRAHLEHIPFENLDIHLGNPVILDEELLFEKIVNRHRGGFCYELNGLFAALLEALGYGVTRLSARVFDDGEPGPEFDHLLLLVDLKAEAGWCYLVDVGFGEAFRVPLRLEADRQQPQPWGTYRLSVVHDEWTYWAFDGKEVQWQPQYIFTLQPRLLSDFDAMCRYHQTSPSSLFTQKRVATLATHDGRITLRDNRLIHTSNGGRQETILPDERSFIRALKTHFDILLDDDKENKNNGI